MSGFKIRCSPSLLLYENEIAFPRPGAASAAERYAVRHDAGPRSPCFGALRQIRINSSTWETTIAKSASDRRFQKRVEDLGELFANEPESFQRVWQALFKNWVKEVRFREHAQLRESSPDPIPAIFGILNKARALAVAVGADGDAQVADALSHLEHICAQAVSRVTDSRLYRFDRDCTARLR